MDAICTVEGCGRPLWAKRKGLCNMHYKRQYKGQPLGPATAWRDAPRVQCRVDGCAALADSARGLQLCHKHYHRWRRHGDPLTILATERGTVRVETVEWNGVVFRRYPDSQRANHRRYFSPGGGDRARGVGALHQEVWKHHFGPIPKGYHVHHRNEDLTDNRPENLELVSAERHLRDHQRELTAFGRSPAGRAHLDRIRPLAAAWHRSPEGRAWHREHARAMALGTQRRRRDAGDTGGAAGAGL